MRRKYLFLLVLCAALIFPLTLSAKDVTLAWDTNVEADLAGYNVYRSERGSQGTWSAWGTPINGTALVTGPAYIDAGLDDTKSYTYTVTAVDTSGNESGASNPAVDLVPCPDCIAPSSPGGVHIQ